MLDTVLHFWSWLSQHVMGWLSQQRQNLQNLWKKCIPATIAMILLWLAGTFLIISGPLSGWTLLATTVIVSLIPLALALHWLIQIPLIWGINSSWVGLFLLAVTAGLALYGSYSAGIILNALFHENPGTFPIAYALGSYFMATIGLTCSPVCPRSEVSSVQGLVLC